MPGSESPTLAGPPGDCCFTTVKHTGDPVGRKILIADVPTYISEPPQGTPGAIDTKKIILFFADVWGPFFPNNQLLQDYFASHGEELATLFLFTEGVVPSIVATMLTAFVICKATLFWA